jgi:hypothetical protein
MIRLSICLRLIVARVAMTGWKHSLRQVEEAELTLTGAGTLRVRRFDKTDFRKIVPRFTTENRRAT